MNDDPELFNQLSERLDELVKKQAALQREIAGLRNEVAGLKPVPPASNDIEQPVVSNEPGMPPAGEPESAMPEENKWSYIRGNLEKFIGENLINRIGIAITVIGVGIGVKYAIDHDLISPWTRIILGYLAGLALFAFAARLRKKHAGFSSVLLSGAMATFYFITFAAYNFYGLIPQAPAFLLMVFFTVFTVAASLHYDRQVIAHFGLVGAYAVPFLLDDGSGRVVVMFTYMALINSGILVIAFRKNWKLLYYSAFGITWLIFFTWFLQKYDPAEHFALAFTFNAVFFTLFYLIFLGYRMLKNDRTGVADVLLLLANSWFFFGIGYSVLNRDASGEHFLGLFTLVNAMVHAAVALIPGIRKSTDRNLFSLVAGLALVFLTIAVPVQWDGRWVTMLWAGEVALLFGIGRMRGEKVYELLSYPLMLLVFFSLVHDWATVYKTFDPLVPGSRIFPLFNINFLTSLMLIASFGFINFLNQQPKYVSPMAGQKILLKLVNFSLPALLMTVSYFAFIMEITTFWNQQYTASMVTTNLDLTIPQHIWNEDIHRYGTLSVINYSLLFLAVMSFSNIRLLKKPMLGMVNLGLNMIGLGIFLTIGLFTIGELRESYISQTMAGYFYRGGFLIGLRYVSFAFAFGLLYAVYRYVRWDRMKADFYTEYDFLLHITLLTIVSNELINWMDLYRPGQSYKLGLSILFGVYALLMIVLGIVQKKVHLRIGAMVLFAATLLKLLLYDLQYLNTISKTIVFVTLGVLLLISSFLYTKYRKQIFGEHEAEQKEHKS